MQDPWLNEQVRLRDAALAELRSSSAFRAFVAFEAAVVTLGGNAAVLSALSPTAAKPPVNEVEQTPIKKTVSNSGVTTQGGFALAALEKVGRPLKLQELFEVSQRDGLHLSGKDPFGNFRSSVSRDSRVKAYGKNNKFVWWFADRELPSDEAEPNMLAKLNGSASHSNQEGEPHAEKT